MSTTRKGGVLITPEAEGSDWAATLDAAAELPPAAACLSAALALPTGGRIMPAAFASAFFFMVAARVAAR